MTVGTIAQRSPGSWRVRLELARDGDTGRRRYRTKTVRGTYQEALGVLEELVLAPDPLVVTRSRSGPLNPHGARARYAYGCRCELCRAAAADYQWRLRQRREPTTTRPHGTPARYRARCRCHECTRAMSEYKRLWRAAQPKKPSSRRRTVRHGTRTGYGYGCRCERCRAAERVARREWRAGRDDVDPATVHGTRAALEASRLRRVCRCAACRDVALLRHPDKGRGGGPRPTPRPFALDLLLEAAHLESLVAASRLFGVHYRQVHRWRTGGLTADLADELAIQAGLHPAEVWAAWADTVAA